MKFIGRKLLKIEMYCIYTLKKIKKINYITFFCLVISCNTGKSSDDKHNNVKPSDDNKILADENIPFIEKLDDQVFLNRGTDIKVGNIKTIDDFNKQNINKLSEEEAKTLWYKLNTIDFSSKKNVLELQINTLFKLIFNKAFPHNNSDSMSMLTDLNIEKIPKDEAKTFWHQFKINKFFFPFTTNAILNSWFIKLKDEATTDNQPSKPNQKNQPSENDQTDQGIKLKDEPTTDNQSSKPNQKNQSSENDQTDQDIKLKDILDNLEAQLATLEAAHPRKAYGLAKSTLEYLYTNTLNKNYQLTTKLSNLLNRLGKYLTENTVISKDIEKDYINNKLKTSYGEGHDVFKSVVYFNNIIKQFNYQLNKIPKAKEILKYNTLPKNKNKTCILATGGSYNPPHIQHILNLFDSFLAMKQEGYKIDKIYLIPVHPNYLINKYKNNSDRIIFSVEERFELLKILKDDMLKNKLISQEFYDKLVISDHETKETSFIDYPKSYEMLKNTLGPNINLIYVFGEDMLKSYDSYENFVSLQQKINYSICIQRDPKMSISSTQIMQNDKQTLDLLKEKVPDYYLLLMQYVNNKKNLQGEKKIKLSEIIELSQKAFKRYNRPYEQGGSFAVTKDINNKEHDKVFRPNHAIHHGVRQAFLTSLIIKMLLDSKESNDLAIFVKNKIKQDNLFIKKMLGLALFLRTGRKQEILSSGHPDFKESAEESQKFYETDLADLFSGEKEKKTYSICMFKDADWSEKKTGDSILIYKIISSAHIIDLLRMGSYYTKDSIKKRLKNILPLSESQIDILIEQGKNYIETSGVISDTKFKDNFFSYNKNIPKLIADLYNVSSKDLQSFIKL